MIDTGPNAKLVGLPERGTVFQATGEAPSLGGHDFVFGELLWALMRGTEHDRSNSATAHKEATTQIAEYAGSIAEHVDAQPDKKARYSSKTDVGLLMQVMGADPQILRKHGFRRSHATPYRRDAIVNLDYIHDLIMHRDASLDAEDRVFDVDHQALFWDAAYGFLQEARADTQEGNPNNPINKNRVPLVDAAEKMVIGRIAELFTQHPLVYDRLEEYLNLPAGDIRELADLPRVADLPLDGAELGGQVTDRGLGKAA